MRSTERSTDELLFNIVVQSTPEGNFTLYTNFHWSSK